MDGGPRLPRAKGRVLGHARREGGVRALLGKQAAAGRVVAGRGRRAGQGVGTAACCCPRRGGRRRRRGRGPAGQQQQEGGGGGRAREDGPARRAWPSWAAAHGERVVSFEGGQREQSGSRPAARRLSHTLPLHSPRVCREASACSGRGAPKTVHALSFTPTSQLLSPHGRPPGAAGRRGRPGKDRGADRQADALRAHLARLVVARFLTLTAKPFPPFHSLVLTLPRSRCLLLRQ